MRNIIAIAAASMLFALAGCSADKAAVEPLHVEGTTLMNASGEAVVLKGISIGWHNLWPRFYNAGAVAIMHNDWGCNLFRAAIGADDLDELLNEPVSFAFENEHSYADLGDPEAMQACWRALKLYADDLIKVITDIDDSHPLILMGSPCWDQRIDLPANDPITSYDNLMYTVHFYAATHKESLRQASEAAFAAGLPIFISECASMEASGYLRRPLA